MDIHNFKQQLTIEAVRIFDDAILQAVHSSPPDVEEAVRLRDMRREVMDLINSQDSIPAIIQGIEDRIDAFVDDLSNGRTIRGVSQRVVEALTDLSFTASSMQNGFDQDGLLRLSHLAYLEDDESTRPSVKSAINQHMNRMVLQLIDRAEDIGLLRKVLPAWQAVRGDLIAIAVFTPPEHLVQGLKAWIEKPNRVQQLGPWMHGQIERMIADVERIQTSMQSTPGPSL